MKHQTLTVPETITGTDFLLPWSLRFRHVVHAMFNTNFDFAYSDQNYKPYDFEKDYYTKNGTKFRVYFLDGDGGRQKSLQLHIGGLRSDVEVYSNMFKAYKQRGNPAIFVDLPQPRGNCDNFDEIRDVVSHVLENPPIIPEKHINKPISLSTHSTSAGLLLCTLLENKDGIGERIHNRYKRLIAYSTFIHPPFVKNKLSNFFYWTAHGGKNSIYGTSLWDRCYSAVLCLKGQPGAGKQLARLRHGEIQYMSYEVGEEFSRIAFSTPIPDYLKNSGKLSFVHGELDYVASHDTALAVAKPIGCQFVSMADTFHNPFSRERAIKLCEHFHQYTPSFAPREIKGLEEDIENLWYAAKNRFSKLNVYAPRDDEQELNQNPDGVVKRARKRLSL